MTFNYSWVISSILAHGPQAHSERIPVEAFGVHLPRMLIKNNNNLNNGDLLDASSKLRLILKMTALYPILQNKLDLVVFKTQKSGTAENSSHWLLLNLLGSYFSKSWLVGKFKFKKKKKRPIKPYRGTAQLCIVGGYLYCIVSRMQDLN